MLTFVVNCELFNPKLVHLKQIRDGLITCGFTSFKHYFSLTREKCDFTSFKHYFNHTRKRKVTMNDFMQLSPVCGRYDIRFQRKSNPEPLFLLPSAYLTEMPARYHIQEIK